MKRATFAVIGVGLASALLVALTGCSQSVVSPSVEELPTVEVALPIEREVVDYADFTARTAPMDAVEVRARVDGYLESVHFEAGSLVNMGDVLFVIDQRPFLRELDRAKAQLELAHAQYEQALAQVESAEAAKARADADSENTRLRIERAEKLLPRGAMSQEEFDMRKSDLLKAEAGVRHAIAGIASAKAAVISAQAAESAARAAVALAELNLDYTTVTAPITGRISRNAYFDVDENTVQRVQQMIRAGSADDAREVELPVWLGLANEEGYPHRGIINFIDNQVRPSTGTLRVRGVFPNHDEALVAGYFGRIRVPIGNPHKALLIADRSVEMDQGQKVAFFVDKENKVVSRPVRLGALHDGLREIVEGLQPGDRVIVNGLQQVRPGVTVSGVQVAMPASGPLHGAVASGSQTAPAVQETATRGIKPQ
ncbi:MAG TPA: efflux RND transporter periplasmic adaptor subunit [Lacipirellulaceae bacterium]|nr:efflux RND transporter periplasmic adaptor subunit [Lacipirellulaceae bacterium]